MNRQTKLQLAKFLSKTAGHYKRPTVKNKQMIKQKEQTRNTQRLNLAQSAGAVEYTDCISEER